MRRGASHSIVNGRLDTLESPVRRTCQINSMQWGSVFSARATTVIACPGILINDES